MPHPLLRATHTAHVYHDVETGETGRGESPITAPEEYATVGGRLTDEGQPITQMRGGTVATDRPILAVAGRTLLDSDPPITEGHHVALEGGGFGFDPDTDPRDADGWFSVEQVTKTFGLGRRATGVELVLNEA